MSESCQMHDVKKYVFCFDQNGKKIYFCEIGQTEHRINDYFYACLFDGMNC